MALPDLDDDQRHRIAVIAESYRRLAGRPLVSGGGDAVASLWAAPLAILAHGVEVDPVFFFGNRMALSLFEDGLRGIHDVAFPLLCRAHAARGSGAAAGPRQPLRTRG